jgi:hypothetical protein
MTRKELQGHFLDRTMTTTPVQWVCHKIKREAATILLQHQYTLINCYNENDIYYGTMEIDDNMILVYLNQQSPPSLLTAKSFYFRQQSPYSIPTNQTINNTVIGNGDSDMLPEIPIYRAVLAFLLTILLYFFLVCHAWKEEVSEGKPEVIERSLVRKVSL